MVQHITGNHRSPPKVTANYVRCLVQRVASELNHSHQMAENLAPLLSDLLTIVIPTRDRLDFLEICLQSIFDRQAKSPRVIVSDNSSSDVPGMETLCNKYDFLYVRQSGKLSMTDHHNACLKLCSTPWALLLHDDDELCPNILGRLESFLTECDGAGIVIAGIEYIDQQGTPRGVWVPGRNEILRGNEGVLRIGLDFQTSPPGWVWNVKAFHQAGGFPDAHGAAADYPLVLQVAFSDGVALFSEIVGRYRIGEQQITNYSTPKEAEATLDCSIKMAQLTRTIGVSANVADQLVDYMTWSIFRIVAGSLLESHSFFVSRVCQKCRRVTPPEGQWRRRVRAEYPFLFWWPQSVWILIYRSAIRYFPRFLRRKLWTGLRKVSESVS